MKILFSPLSTDVREFELNGLSDVCRCVNPDQIRLCLPDGVTAESLSEPARELLKELSHSYDLAVTYYDAADPATVSDYLIQLRTDMPDCQIIVNRLGGSDELQAALLLLADDPVLNLTFADGSEEFTEADVPEAAPEEVTVSGEDSDAAAAPAETDSEELKMEAVNTFGKALLSELIASYDYHGALVLSRKLGDAVPEIVPFLLEAADMRSDGRFADANQMFRRCGLEGIMTGQQALAEYYLLLDLYVKEQRYTDFLRAMKPFLLEILIAAIRKQFNMDITRYMIYGSRRWDENKLVLEQMTGKFNETFAYHTKPKPCKAGGYVTTAHLSNLMENLSVQRQHATLILDTMKLRLNAEERVRTLAFYNMQGVTAQDIEKACACRPEDILTMILNYVRNYTDIVMTDEMLSSYQQMNEMICSYL